MGPRPEASTGKAVDLEENPHSHWAQRLLSPAWRLWIRKCCGQEGFPGRELEGQTEAVGCPGSRVKQDGR